MKFCFLKIKKKRHIEIYKFSIAVRQEFIKYLQGIEVSDMAYGAKGISYFKTVQ